MASMMALQLYFTNQTQQDVLGELNRFSRTVNSATDEFFVRAENTGKKSDIEAKVAKVKQKWTWAFEDSLGDILDNNEIELKTDLNMEDSLIRILNKEKKIQNSGLANLTVKIDSLRKTTVIMESRALKVDKIPARERLKIFKKKLHDVFAKSERTSETGRRKTNERIEFVMPAIAAKAPGILRFSYSTSNLQSALTDIRDRNILISVALFLLALAVIMFIANRFLQPINTLKHAFERVVDGDLSAGVDVNSQDEIGVLSASFNQMVLELRKNREKETMLRRKERLASLGQLAAGVAHEIKNPLNAINLTIQHLNDKFIDTDDAPARKYVDVIQSEIRRLDKIVNNFLSYIRSEKLEIQPVEMTVYIRDILQLYHRELTMHRIKFSLEATESCTFTIDPERFKTVIMNIVINAIQAMPDGGELMIKLNDLEKSVAITDTGIGIPQKNMEHIFDLFYTTKGSGSGLGLPTAYKIVKEHGGDLRIDSREKTGTTVYITLT